MSTMSSETIIKQTSMETEELKITDKNGLIARNACSNCNRLLNVSPIFCIEVNNGMQKICGRCTHIVSNFSGKKLRQHIFEDLAEYLTYPCSNKQYGCNSVFPWESVVAHESVCKYQYIPCVLSYDLFPGNDCNWIGNVRNIDEHIKTNHKDYIVTNSPIKISFDGLLENKIFFTHVGGKLITVMVQFQAKHKYYCLIMINGNDMDSQCYQYQLELFIDDNKERSILLRKHKLETLGCLSDNLKNIDKLLEVDLDQIKAILGSTQKITGCFGIVKKNRKLIKQITGKEISVSKPKLLPLDESVLQELECPVCNQYMISKIYICHAGK